MSLAVFQLVCHTILTFAIYETVNVASGGTYLLISLSTTDCLIDFKKVGKENNLFRPIPAAKPFVIVVCILWSTFLLGLNTQALICS